jgi:hypothetical protein
MLGPCKQKHHLPSNPTSTVNQPLIIQINAMKSLSEIKVKSERKLHQLSHFNFQQPKKKETLLLNRLKSLWLPIKEILQSETPI